MRDARFAVVRCLVIAAGLCVSIDPAAAEQSITYTGSLQVSNGDYIFADRTTSIYFVNGIEIAGGPVRVSGTVPIIGQSTPWVSYGPAVVPAGGTLSAEVARQVGPGRRNGPGGRTLVTLPLPTGGVAYSAGVGDPLVRADVELLTDDGSRPSLRLNASTKFPLADVDDGFGTGAWDHGVGVSLAKRLDRSSVFVDVGYWNFGDLPDLVLKEAVVYSLAYGRVLGAGRWSLLTSLSGWTAILDGVVPPVQVGVGLSRLITPSRSLSLSAGVGLTETAPDISISLGWRLEM